MDVTPLQSAIAAVERALARIGESSDAIGTIGGALEARRALDDVLAASVDSARTTGATWQTIGDILGTSRQAAFQRFGHPIDPRTGSPMNTTPLPRADALAADIFARIALGDWASVYTQFDDTMKAAITQEKLAEGWAQAAAMVGAFESQGEPFVRAADTMTIVDIPLAFEAGDMVGRVAFDAAGQIAGLFILTPSAAAGL